MKKSYVTYGNYGKCMELSCKNTTIRITCDFGSRIIYLAGSNGKNLMCEDKNDLVNKGGEYFDEHFGKGATWHIYGGHRLWKSPEDLASYFPDNDPVMVTDLPNGGIFTSAPETTTTGIQKSLKITMDDNGAITIEHIFKNISDKTVDYSLWALSVMDKGGVAYIPLSTEDTGLLANRNLVIWPYTNIKDARIDLRQSALILRQDEHATTNIKLGLCNTEGLAYYLRGSELLEKTVTKASRYGEYPDMVCSLETYTSPLMLELETLSEIKHIAPNDIATHTEIWNLYQVGDRKYDEIKKIIG